MSYYQNQSQLIQSWMLNYNLSHSEQSQGLADQTHALAAQPPPSCEKAITQPQQQTQSLIQNILVAIFCLLWLTNLQSWLPVTYAPQTYTIGTPNTPKLIEQRLPRILWIYTQNQRDAQPMQNDLYLKYYAHIAQKANYEVRETDSWLAYDYLSNETTMQITEAMSKRKVNENVHGLLKLALLAEHGGIMLQPGTLFLRQNFNWIQEMFDRYEQNFTTNFCTAEESYFYMSGQMDKYRKSVMAAVPKSALVRQIFDLLRKIVVTEISSNNTIEGIKWNEYLGVYEFEDAIQNCANHILKSQAPIKPKYCGKGMQQTAKQLLMLTQQQAQISREIAFSGSGLQTLMGRRGLKDSEHVIGIAGLNTAQLTRTLAKLALGRISRQSTKNGLIYRALVVPKNRQLFLEDLPQRQIELCLVMMEGLTHQQLKQTSTLFSDQTYERWKLVMPAKDANKAPKLQDRRILVIQQKSNKVHNIQKAVAKYCPHNGYAVVLNYNETFNSIHALSEIAEAVQAREVGGLYLSLQLSAQVHPPIEEYIHFNRYYDGISNPKLHVMRHFLNHFRVFAVETFKMIPQFAMRDLFGKYMDDRVIFLMDFLDLVYLGITDPYLLCAVKKNSKLWNMPTRIALLPPHITLKIQQFQQLNLEQLKATRTRVETWSNRKMLLDIQNNYMVPFSKLVSFNHGEDFVPVHEKSGEEIIPRVIHQVWLGSADKLPPAKQYFYDKTKRVYPSFEVKLWREANLTREKFPLTYDLIMTLISFNKHSPFNKLATVTDIMRHELLYYEGGLWKDAGMNMLRPIPTHLLKYKLILPVDRLLSYRYLQGMCFFGNMPRYDHMLRINNFRNLNRMKIYSQLALSIAGPVDFRQLLIGQEEYDPQIILMPYETFYPGQTDHPDGDLCTTQKVGRRGRFEIVERGWYLMPNCEERYPFAFAIQHNNYGLSWAFRSNSALK